RRHRRGHRNRNRAIAATAPRLSLCAGISVAPADHGEQSRRADARHQPLAGAALRHDPPALRSSTESCAPVDRALCARTPMILSRGTRVIERDRRMTTIALTTDEFAPGTGAPEQLRVGDRDQPAILVIAAEEDAAAAITEQLEADGYTRIVSFENPELG